MLDENGDRHDLEPGDKLEIPAGSVHAEGEVTQTTVYIVGTATDGDLTVDGDQVLDVTRARVTSISGSGRRVDSRMPYVTGSAPRNAASACAEV